MHYGCERGSHSGPRIEAGATQEASAGIDGHDGSTEERRVRKTCQKGTKRAHLESSQCERLSFCGTRL